MIKEESIAVRYDVDLSGLTGDPEAKAKAVAEAQATPATLTARRLGGDCSDRDLRSS